MHLDRVFHATEDPQAVRDEVLSLLAQCDIRMDATMLERSKAQDHPRERATIDKMAWYLHFKHVASQVTQPGDRLFVAAANIGTKKARGAMHSAIDDVVHRVARRRSHRVAFWPAESNPCLQVADYCTWAIQRKWERDDARSHVLIADKLESEFDV